MGVFSRMSDIFNSNINAMLDKAENPEKIIRLIIQEMEDTLVEVRSAAARAIADKKQVTRRVSARRREANEWQRKAELAVSKGRDDLAKAALSEKRRVSEAIDANEHELEQIEDGLTKLNDDIAQLQAKLADAKSRQKSLVLRQKTASHRLHVRSQLSDDRINDALSKFESYEQRMDHLEGQVESYDLGRKKGLHDEFAELETDDKVEQELQELKQKVSGHSSAPAQ
jgi:phage shock protein A